MSELEEAIKELGRCSWTGINVITGNTDWITEAEFKHLESCPIRHHYESLVRAASGVKLAWNKTSAAAKQMLFDAAMDGK